MSSRIPSLFKVKRISLPLFHSFFSFSSLPSFFLFLPFPLFFSAHPPTLYFFMEEFKSEVQALVSESWRFSFGLPVFLFF